MVKRTADHPSWEELLAYGQGRLEPSSVQTLEDHLAECRSCCELLETAPADSFLSRLRDAETDSASVLDRSIPMELIDHPRYRVVELIGEGGMGAVYRAEHRRMERMVALKVMRSSLMRQQSAVQRFQQEVRTAARLHHPNIVTAHDADQAGDLHFLVMEYVEGRNLADYLREQGPLPVEEACRYARQAALGLQHAHEQGMVHRDIKPHNLMLTPQGEVKILDFGLARLPRTVEELPSGDRSSGSLTATGVVMGTADYVAPEQAADPRTADIRADIYALGCTLFHLLCGRPPFPEGTVAEKLAHHAKTPLPPLTRMRPEMPPRLVAVLERMTAKNPARRYSTPAAAAEALAPFCFPIRQPRRPTPRKRRWLVAAAALTAVGLVFACVLLSSAVALTSWLLRPVANNGSPVANDPGPAAVEQHQEPIVLDPGPQPVDPGPIAGGGVMDVDPAEQAAIEIVRKHKGWFIQDNTPPNKVIRVSVESPEFTDAELRKLASLTQVREMYVGRCGITGAGFADLKSLKNLVDLNVSQSPIDDAGLKAIAGLTQLKILSMSGTKVTDGGLRALESLTQLEELHLSGSRLGDTAALHVAANAKSLKKLYFDNSDIGDAGVSELAKMPHLQLITLNGTRVTNTGVTALTKLTALEELHLSHFEVTDATATILARCKNLHVLHLFDASITDKGLRTLGTLPLTKLDLKLCRKISIEALTEFIKKHPNCSVKR